MLIIVVAVILFYSKTTKKNKTVLQLSDYDMAEIDISEQKMSVYIAESNIQQQYGLSIVDKINDNEGMLFLYQGEQTPTFWMKDMHFDIDIIWIKDEVIIGITQNLSYLDQQTRYYPENEVDAVLEVKSGFCQRHDVKIDDKIKISRKK